METIKTTDRQRNILWVDDDKDMLMDLKDYLNQEEVSGKHHINFIFAHDAKEAMKKIAEMDIDLIILEVLLPIVSGYYFLNVLKKRKADIPVILYTKLKGPQDLAKMAATDVSNIFLKSLTKVEELIEKIISEENLKTNLDRLVIDLQNKIKPLVEEEEKNRLSMLQCPRCHAIVGRDAHFCNNCGQKIIKEKKAGIRAKEPVKDRGQSKKEKPKKDQPDTKEMVQAKEKEPAAINS